MRAYNMGVVWWVTSTTFSACLYLFDFLTTISALMTYYSYEYHCPHHPPSSPLLLGADPICRAIRSNPVLARRLAIQFWGCLSFLLVAYPTYAFMFWISLPPHEHPLRLAYFMPLIHLYRLLQLLYRSSNIKELEELQKRQREVNSLYNALGASLESANQFNAQFMIAIWLGEYIRGSTDPNVQAQRIPTNLILSLAASLASGSYGTGMAVSLVMGSHVPLATRTYVGIVVGCQTISSMLVKAMSVAALSLFSKGFPTLTLIYMIIGMVIAWVYVGVSCKIYQRDYQGNNIFFKLIHSFAMALMIRPISPIYMIVKEGKSLHSLIWGTLAHNLVDLIGIVIMLVRPSNLKEQESPCQCLHMTGTKEECNRYLTCKIFLVTMFLSILVLILTNILFIFLYKKNKDDARDMVETYTNTHIVCNNATLIETHTSSSFEGRSLHQMSTLALFKLILVVMTFLFIKKLQVKSVLQG